jgi:peptidase inhibitor I9
VWSRDGRDQRLTAWVGPDGARGVSHEDVGQTMGRLEAKMLAAAGRRVLFAVRASPVAVAVAVALAIVLGGCDRTSVEPTQSVVRVVPGEYIVVFKDYVTDVRGLAHQIAEQYHGTVLSTFEPTLKGFAVRLQEPARITVIRISAHPDVKHVEPNRIGTVAVE